MPKFSYRAITEEGSTATGAIEAESADKANSMLAAQGFICLLYTSDAADDDRIV